MTAPIRYARSGDVNIAYQVTGEGPFDLVLVPGFFSHLEIDWEYPAHGSLARAARVLCATDPLRQTRHRTIRPRESGFPISRPVWTTSVLSWTESGASSRRFSATRKVGRCASCSQPPTRTVRALALYGTYAKRRDPDEEYPWAPTWEARPGERKSRGDVGRERQHLQDVAGRGLGDALLGSTGGDGRHSAPPRRETDPDELGGGCARRAP